MADTILKSFLVRLGFKIDDTQFRNFNDGMNKIAKSSVDLAKNFVKLGEASALAVTGMGASMVAVGKQLEGLYYVAQRTGASAKELDIFSFAAEQVGVSADTARGAIDRMAAARRNNPGLNGILGGLGIDPRQTDNAKTMVALITKLRNMDVQSGNKTHFVTSQWAAMFGLDEQSFKQIEDNFPAWVAMMQKRDQMIAASGRDETKQSLQGVEFIRQYNEMKTAVGDFVATLETRLMPIGATVMGWIKDAAIELGKADKATNGWSTRIAGLVVALKALSTAFSVLGKFTGAGKLAGVGRGAAAAEGAAAGGAEAAGGAALASEGAAAGGEGLLATIGLPVIVGAAIVAALVWMQNHPEQVRAAAKKTWEVTKKAAVAVGQAAKTEAHALPGQLHAAAAAMGTFVQQVKAAGAHNTLTALMGAPGVVGSLANMVAGFEGHVKGGYGLYRDIGGKLTAGFGHLVKKGEDFSHLDKAGALALLAKDLQTAAASVAGLVKVKLSKNQQDALADFVFNVGKGNLAKSTLLRKLNSGDFAGAAGEFEKWNKVLVNGHYVANQGLANRRAAEAKLFSSPDQKGVQIKQETTIHVTGGDAKNTGKEVAQQQSRVNGDMVRNFASAVQ